MNFLKFTFKWLLFLGIWLVTFAVLALIYYCKDLPSLSDLEAQNSKESGKEIVQINFSDDSRIAIRGDIYSSEVNYYELPQNLINAVVAVEDRKFFKHFGIDIFGIMRAFMANREAGRIVQGGSTITQQLAKLLFLDPQRTMKRKIQEVLLAIQLERNFTKEQILTFYLNRAYFGAGNYGIVNAAKFYFKKDVSDLNLNEAALLAGLLKAPSKFSPKNNLKLAKERAEVVISTMIDAGFLGEENLNEIDGDNISYKVDHLQKLYFVDYAYNQFRDVVGEESEENSTSNLGGGLFKVKTTLDEKIQNKVENILDETLQNHEKTLLNSQISVLVMNKEGAILAMSGGNDYQQSQFNRAVSAKRQAGSAFKTLVYLAAFEDGFAPENIFEDKKINFGNWIPQNFNSRYLGEVTLEDAFANSLNSVAIQLAKKTGGKKIANLAHKLGISAAIDVNDPTIALGTSEVTLLEITSAYAAISNEGKPVIPYAINDIKDDQNNVVYSRQSSGFDAVISEQAIAKIKQVLRKVVQSGSGKKANVADNVYGKTGTSQNFRDAWFVGFDDDYVVGVWIGNDDNSPTKEILGGTLPAEIFGKIIADL